MKCGVVTFPGSNCNHDMIYALEKFRARSSNCGTRTKTLKCELIVLPVAFLMATI